jgi:hypothetical protein
VTPFESDWTPVTGGLWSPWWNREALEPASTSVAKKEHDWMINGYIHYYYLYFLLFKKCSNAFEGMKSHQSNPCLRNDDHLLFQGKPLIKKRQ